jgi:hypothetical protein
VGCQTDFSGTRDQPQYSEVTLRRLDLAGEIYHIREPQKIPLVMPPSIDVEQFLEEGP